MTYSRRKKLDVQAQKMKSAKGEIRYRYFWRDWDDNGHRVYAKAETKAEARKEFLSWLASREMPLQRQSKPVDSQLLDEVLSGLVTGNKEPMNRFFEQQTTSPIEIAIPPNELTGLSDAELANRVLSMVQSWRVKHCKPKPEEIAVQKIKEWESKPTEKKNRLSDALVVWEKANRENKENTEQHIKSTKNLFNVFVEFCHDKPVSKLSLNDFDGYNGEIKAQARTGKLSGKWINDRLAVVPQVLKQAFIRTPKWNWSTGLTNWYGLLVRAPYKPDEDNKIPMPPEIFKRLLAKADKQFKALLMFACNVGANHSDLMVSKAHLHLSEPQPYFDLPRQKTGVKRVIPLHRETVKAIKSWLKERGAIAENEPVFVQDNGNTWYKERLANKFRELKLLAGIKENGEKYRFIALRNVGATIARNVLRNDGMASFHLGHTSKSVDGFYQDTPEPSYLMPLIDEIGKRYF